MLPMLPKTRLILCGMMIVVSAIYGILVASNPRVASAIMLGYIALLLTIFVAVEVWKKP